MASSTDTYSQNGSQPESHHTEIPQVALIIIICVGVCVLFLAGLSIWSYFLKRHDLRSDMLSLPRTSNHDRSPRSSGPETKICLSDNHLDIGSTNPQQTPETIYQSKFCEDFDFPLPVLSPIANTNEPMSNTQYNSPTFMQNYGSPPTWASQNNLIAGCPEHLTFVPKVLLTGNLLQPKPAVTSDLRPPGLNSHERVIIRSQPGPRSCKMTPAEASNDLRALIEQLNLRIFAAFDGDESLTASTVSSNPSSPSFPFSNPTSPSIMYGDHKPFYGLPMMNGGSPLYLPLPFPRYNDRQITPIRRSLSYLH